LKTTDNRGIKKYGTTILYGFMLACSDIIIVGASSFLAYYLRFFTGFFKPAVIIAQQNQKYLFYSLIFLGSILFFYLIFRLYNLRTIYKDPFYYLKIFAPPVIGIILIVFIDRFDKSLAFSRLWILFLAILSVVLLFFSRYLFGIVTKKIIKAKDFYEKDIIFGFRDNIGALKSVPRFNKKIVYGIFLIISDAIFLALSFYFSYFLRFKTGAIAELNKTYFIEKNYFFYSLVFIVASILIFFIFNLYDRDRIYKGSGYYSRLFRVVFINIIVIIFVGYIFEQFTFSRKWILLLALFNLVLVFFGRFSVEIITQKLIKKYGIIPRTLIVGIGENARRIENSLKKYSKENDIILGHVDRKQRIDKDKQYSKAFTILGYLENLKEIIYKNNIQRVIISSPEFKYDEILDILEKLKGLDITVLLFPGFFEFSLRRLSVREIGGVPLMQVANIGFFGINLFLKNLIDYVLGVILFIFFILIYLVVGFMIKINSKGPVFFKQKRMTKDCKIFHMYKFRTMYIDAEERLKELAKCNEADGPLFKMKNDPRITKVGRFLRRFSIDEIPQIINVLKGDLSLVGPRPPLPVEVQKYNDWEIKRMNVKQGLTGLWQVSGRSDLSFEEMARLDLYYIQNWSIEMDIKIIIKTIPTMLFGKGAY
jgi:exopolysaccharide biosynthesis polyprenyl glycosylphosphotransferase